MWWIGRLTGLCVLLMLSWRDIQTREVPVKPLICSCAVVILYHLTVWEMNVWMLAGGAGVGVLFLLISKATGEGIGYGDSWVILILGIYLGLWRLIETLCAAFVLLGIFSAVILCRKRMSKKCTLPFFPFLAGGYLLMFLSEGVGM